MARPKSSAPKKKNMTLMVTDDTRDLLAAVSIVSQKSLSEHIVQWGEQEAERLNITAEMIEELKKSHGQQSWKRSKRSALKKKNMTLVVTDDTRDLLAAVSIVSQKSLSELIVQWGEQEAERLNITAEMIEELKESK